jgi:hypothetical protein
MSARLILTEMHELLAGQVEHVVAGDHQALLAGAARHEQLLHRLRTAEMDAPPEEIRALAERVEREKQKLQSLLTTQSQRVDFMLRLLIGGGEAPRVGYPGRGLGTDPRSGRLNRRA